MASQIDSEAGSNDSKPLLGPMDPQKDSSSSDEDMVAVMAVKRGRDDGNPGDEPPAQRPSLRQRRLPRKRGATDDQDNLTGKRSSASSPNGSSNQSMASKLRDPSSSLV